MTASTRKKPGGLSPAKATQKKIRTQTKENDSRHPKASSIPARLITRWYDRPYWLGPDGETDDYFALAEAIVNQGVEGVARWTMRKKRYVGALRSVQGYLALITLRHAEEIISADDLEPPSGRQLDKKERDLAGQLVAALRADFDPADYQDEYRQRLMELIETKREGGTVEVEEYEEAPPPKSLAESSFVGLQVSVHEVQKVNHDV